VSAEAAAVSATVPALRVDGLRATYGKSQVLSDVSLDVAPGEIAVLLGRNGAGKTTTLRTLAGVHPPRAGRVLLHGDDMSRWPAHHRVREGLVLVSQGARAFGPLSVEENLRLIRGRPGDPATVWSLDDVYARFPKLGLLRRSAGGSLSGGERQMLALGRALRANPTVIMLDEPSEGLAPIVVQQIMGILGELRAAGIAVLLAEQNHRAALRAADRCFILEKGQVVHAGPAHAVRGSELLARHLGV
jgi:branched-chain amino acid transport system ATP-binding protein